MSSVTSFSVSVKPVRSSEAPWEPDVHTSLSVRTELAWRPVCIRLALQNEGRGIEEHTLFRPSLLHIYSVQLLKNVWKNLKHVKINPLFPLHIGFKPAFSQFRVERPAYHALRTADLDYFTRYFLRRNCMMSC